MKYPRPEILNTYLNRFSIEFESPKACVPRELQEAEFLDVVGKVKRFPNMKVRRSNDGDFAVRHPDEVQLMNHSNAIPNRAAAIKGALKYNKNPSPEMSTEVGNALVEASDWMEREFLEEFSASEVISFEDSCAQLNRNTSCGFPMNLLYADKTEMIESEGVGFLAEFDNQLLELPVPCCVWMSALKEELRADVKLKDNNIRQIMGAPAQFVVSMNRYTLQRNERLYARNLKTSSAVGMTPYYGGWNRVYKILSKHPSGFVGDYAKLDSTLLGIFILHQADKTWTGLRKNLRKAGCSKDEIETHRQRFYKLVNEEINSLMLLPDGSLVMKHLGTPSGSNNTVVINTLAIFQLMAACFIYHCCGTYEVFKAFVAVVLYGDDKTFTVANELVDKFNGKSLQEFVSLFGMTLKVNHEPKPPMELEFLSFGFVQFGLGRVGLKPTRCDKYHAGLARRDDGKPATRLARLSSFMQLLFVADKCRDTEAQHLVKLIKTYRQELLEKYDPLLGDLDEWRTAKSTWMTDQNLFNLHFGSESCEQRGGQPVFEWGTPRLKLPYTEWWEQGEDLQVRRREAATARRVSFKLPSVESTGRRDELHLRTGEETSGRVEIPNTTKVRTEGEIKDHHAQESYESNVKPSKADRFALCVLAHNRQADGEEGYNDCERVRTTGASIRTRQG